MTVFIAVFTLILAGCAANKNVPPGPPGSLAVRFQSDTALFQEGYAQLSGDKRPVDYGKAREAFTLLMNKYPNSKWRNYARSFLTLIDQVRSAKEQGEKEKQAAKKIRELWEEAQRENRAERLKADGELSRQQKEIEHLRQENNHLRQENELLKNNINQLKQLEIDLQRRDKSLR